MHDSEADITLHKHLLIGQGKGRACYQHPNDQTKVLKIDVRNEFKDTIREVNYYTQHISKLNDLRHIPAYHGTIETNLGTAHIFDNVQDQNGNISQSLEHFIAHSDEFTAELTRQLFNELAAYCLKHRIIVNGDVTYLENILVQQISNTHYRLVIIDGLGDTAYIKLLNHIDHLLLQKVKRRLARVRLSVNNAIHARLNSTASTTQ